MTPRQRRPSCALDDASWVVECSEAELANWLGSLRWQPVRLCLQHCLLQVTQCFADSRFELRRMADQVLRPLAEVALWGELPVLQQLWSSFVPLVDSLPCWVSASTMLLVLQRTSAFHLLLQPSPSQPAAPTGMLTTGPPPTAPPAPPPTGGALSTLAAPTLAALGSLVHRVEALLPRLLPVVAQLLDGAASDKVSVLAAQLLVLAHARFGRRLAPLRHQQPAHFDSLVRLLASTYQDAHPPQPTALTPTSAVTSAFAAAGALPSAGALPAAGSNGRASCSAECRTPPSRGSGAAAVVRQMLRGGAEEIDAPRRELDHARLVERSLVTSIKAELPALAAGLELCQRAQLLPWLLAHLRMPPTAHCVPALLEALEVSLQPLPPLPPLPPPPGARIELAAAPMPAVLTPPPEHTSDVTTPPADNCLAASETLALRDATVNTHATEKTPGSAGSGRSGRRLFADADAPGVAASAPSPLELSAKVAPGAAKPSANVTSPAASEVAGDVCETMAHFLAGSSITMSTLKQSLAILRLAVASDPEGLSLASAPSEIAISVLLEGLCDCLRGHGTPSPPSADKGSGGTAAELQRLLASQGAEMHARLLRLEGGGATAGPAGASTLAGATEAAAMDKEAEEAAEEAADEPADVVENVADQDDDSDWDDWDDDDAEEGVVEAGPRYEDVGGFLWWLVYRSGGPPHLETALPRLREAEAALLLAAMRHSARAS